MTVITLTDCPPKLRGDLSKWMIEINTGVYVGRISSRVRDELWQRVCDHSSKGKATMVFRAPGEQRMDFRTHNSAWTPVDYDGIKLVRRPLAGKVSGSGKSAPGGSREGQYQKIRDVSAARTKKAMNAEYTVIDIETTGLALDENCIIELAGIKVCDESREEFSTLVIPSNPVSDSVTELTGITPEMLAAEGRPLKEALKLFLDFVGSDRVVGYNLSFDCAFLGEACKAEGMGPFTNVCTDILPQCRRKIRGIKDYKLRTVAEYFSVDAAALHRALEDCRIAQRVYEKLKNI